MRHRVKGRKLNRTASHRAATLRALATSLFRHKRIKTTVAKAKEARTYVEPLITKAKTDSVHARRHVAQFIYDRDVVTELFTDIVSKVGDRPGGYTRIVKLGRRRGDAAELAFLELVDYNDILSAPKQDEEKPKAEKKSSAKAKETQIEEANVIEETTDGEDVKETPKKKAEKTKPAKKTETTKAKKENKPKAKKEDKPKAKKDDKPKAKAKKEDKGAAPKKSKKAPKK